VLNTAYLDEYRKYLTDERKAAANTVSSYLRDITRFVAYHNETVKSDIEIITEDDVLRYLSDLKENGCSPATFSRCTSSIKAFIKFVNENNGVQNSAEVSIKAVYAKKKPPAVLTHAEVMRLLDQPADAGPKSRRDKAMLETLYATGIRVSELIALDITDVNPETGLITCRNGKERHIPIYAAAISAIDKYMSYARPKMAQPDEKALFVNVYGVRMSRQGLWKILKDLAVKAGITVELTPQILRNSFAMHLLENGVDLQSLQEMLGHAAISSTQVYARLVKQQLKEVYNKSHPRSTM
jgi:integrase/recombinase XerD